MLTISCLYSQIPGLTDSDSDRRDSFDAGADMIRTLNTQPGLLDTMFDVGALNESEADPTAQLGVLPTLTRLTDGAKYNQDMPTLARTPTRTRAATSPERTRVASRSTGVESPTKRQGTSPIVEEQELSQDQLDQEMQED